jgi:serine/threonine-protein kinase
VEQDPAADTTVEAGTEVDLVVSAGSETVTMPDVLGQSERDATAQLTALGLNVESVPQDSDAPQGTVVDTEPRPASEVEAGATVTIYVSNGPQEVPNVVGMDEDEAEQTLEDAGFDVQVEHDTTTPAERGTVLRQEPGGGSEAPRGSTVTITVSDYKEKPSETPSPTPSPSETPTETPTTTPSPSGSPSAGLGGGTGRISPVGPPPHGRR